MAIDISHLLKRYDNKTVVDDVSLTIPKGKITSFIGPNGAGKSTVLWLFAFKGVEKIWPAGKGVGDLRKCKLSHKQKLSPRREQSYLF